MERQSAAFRSLIAMVIFAWTSAKTAKQQLHFFLEVNQMRLIDADRIEYVPSVPDAVISRIVNAGREEDVKGLVHVSRAYIEAQPTVDAVPVIRCEHCKYSKPIDSEWVECQHDKRVMKPTGFCSWAERKEE
jgi:hypothetical protein